MFAFEHGHSWYAGRTFGVPVRLHWSLGLMVAIQLLRTLFDAPRFLVYVLVVELFVVLSIYFHEMAHAMVARFYGLRALDVTLHAFGGFARMSGEAPSKQQVAISAAGPLSNLFLWLVFTGLERFLGIGHFGSMASMVAGFNFILALFNLVPAYPLDGGSMLVHGLRSTAPHAQASWLAFKIGVVVSVPLGIYGLISNNLFLALVFYLTYTASQERLASVGHVGGWAYWKARFRALRPQPRPPNVTPLNVDWQRYAPPGATVKDPPDGDKPPTIN